MTNRRGHAGLTLIEMLAVLMLLALVTVATLGVVPSMAESVRIQNAETGVRDAIDRARLVAMKGDGAVLVVDALELPSGWRASVSDPKSGEAIGEVRFDDRGRSCDLRIEIARRETPGDPVSAWTVLGLSGQVIVERDEL